MGADMTTREILIAQAEALEKLAKDWKYRDFEDDFYSNAQKLRALAAKEPEGEPVDLTLCKWWRPIYRIRAGN